MQTSTFCASRHRRLCALAAARGCLGDFEVVGVQTPRSSDFQVWSWIGVAGFVISWDT